LADLNGAGRFHRDCSEAQPEYPRAVRSSDFNNDDKQAFMELQNFIVDARYARKDWRTI
jgi:hypothetical protein